MDYTRTARAAVAPASSAEEPPRRPHHPALTLWATRPLTVASGRLMGVQLRGQELRVALATSTGVKWVSPHSVMTPEQAEKWVKHSAFKP